MRPTAAIALIAALLPGLAAAQDACGLYETLGAAEAAPRLQTVASGQDRVHFVKGAGEQAGCPNGTTACTTKRYLVAKDPVIVTGVQGGYACATFTGPGPKFATTTGLLPASALADAAVPADDWRGTWRSGDEQEIDIRPAAGDAIAVEGNASWGGSDPERVARGAVNVGQISATLKPAAGKAAFSVGPDGEAAAYDADPGDDSACRVRLWRLGPYLVAADNLACGGMNVTFTGVYRRDK